MLVPRVIVCLCISQGHVVNTVQFNERRYIGDPINAVRIFSEKGADEIFLMDIDASKYNQEPDYALIERIASESSVPLAYAGGIRSVEQACKIISVGVEKIAIGKSAIQEPALVQQIKNMVGVQSVCVILNVETGAENQKSGYSVRLPKGCKGSVGDLETWLDCFTNIGVGEIVVNHIDNDGMLCGLDFNLVDTVKSRVNAPITIMGGAKSFSNLQEVVSRFGYVGIGGSSMFVYKGPLHAVLFNYPCRQKRKNLIKRFIN